MKFQNILMIVIIVLFIASNLLSQENLTSKSAVWIDVSAGIIGMKDIGISYSGDIRWQTGSQIITLQILNSNEFTFDIPIIPDVQPTPREHISSVGILYGRAHSFHLRRMLFPLFPLAVVVKQEADYLISVSIGVATFNNLLRSNRLKQSGGREEDYKYLEEKSFVIGVPIQVELIQKLSPEVGYVHRLFYHWNSIRESWGFQWGVQVYL